MKSERLKLIVFFASLRIFATSSGLMVTVLDVVLEGRILRAFGTLADNSAHIVMVSISSGLFFCSFLQHNRVIGVQ